MGSDEKELKHHLFNQGSEHLRGGGEKMRGGKEIYTAVSGSKHGCLYPFKSEWPSSSSSITLNYSLVFPQLSLILPLKKKTRVPLPISNNRTNVHILGLHCNKTFVQVYIPIHGIRMHTKDYFVTSP